MTPGEIKTFRRNLLAWYDRHRRDLPWRGQGLSPYRTLVSEAMLQQTQVATVVPYFERFMAALPTVDSLAEADEQTVLKLWQGLGYYRRARNLHAAAKMVVIDYAGEVPRTVDELLKLPGVGRYSAGAIASIAYDTPAPILDGNVMRVLCRIEAVEGDPRDTATTRRLWSLAESLVPAKRAGDFNSGLMELGATCCRPKSPTCLICPVRELCQAQQLGKQESIPPVKKAKATPIETRYVFRLRNAAGQWLVEQRPATGRWAGLWQFPTRSEQSAPIACEALDLVGEVKHALTHRRYAFTVFAGTSNEAAPGELKWVDDDELDALPMSKPQQKIREL